MQLAQLRRIEFGALIERDAGLGIRSSSAQLVVPGIKCSHQPRICLLAIMQPALGAFTPPPNIFAAISPALREDGRGKTCEKAHGRCHQRNPHRGAHFRIIGQSNTAR